MGTGAALTGAFVMTGAIVWSMETGAALTRGFVATVITGTIETGTGVGGAGTLVGAVEFASLQRLIIRKWSIPTIVERLRL